MFRPPALATAAAVAAPNSLPARRRAASAFSIAGPTSAYKQHHHHQQRRKQEEEDQQQQQQTQRQQTTTPIANDNGKNSRNRRRFSLPFFSSTTLLSNHHHHQQQQQQQDHNTQQALPSQQKPYTRTFTPPPSRHEAPEAVAAAAAAAAIRSFSDAAKKALLVARVGEENEKEHKFVEAVQAYVYSITLFHRLLADIQRWKKQFSSGSSNDVAATATPINTAQGAGPVSPEGGKKKEHPVSSAAAAGPKGKIDRLEKWSLQMAKVFLHKVRSLTTFLSGKESIKVSVEELIYRHAIKVAKDAAFDETFGAHALARGKYKEAMRLFELLLCSGSRDHDSSNRNDDDDGDGDEGKRDDDKEGKGRKERDSSPKCDEHDAAILGKFISEFRSRIEGRVSSATTERRREKNGRR
mmetsp:Transcript_40436/g.64940  ORF Transcript_40436/g.64940 Transcript_40436/m.64940 type:complete len:410 (-) Transcript_40436:343-1572(-)